MYIHRCSRIHCSRLHQPAGPHKSQPACAPSLCPRLQGEEHEQQLMEQIEGMQAAAQEKEQQVSTGQLLLGPWLLVQLRRAVLHATRTGILGLACTAIQPAHMHQEPSACLLLHVRSAVL